MKIKGVKYWLKLKRLNDSWLKMCSITDKVDNEEMHILSKQMRELIQESDEIEIEKTTKIIISQIKKIESERKVIIDQKVFQNENLRLI